MKIAGPHWGSQMRGEWRRRSAEKRLREQGQRAVESMRSAAPQRSLLGVVTGGDVA